MRMVLAMCLLWCGVVGAADLDEARTTIERNDTLLRSAKSVIGAHERYHYLKSIEANPKQALIVVVDAMLAKRSAQNANEEDVRKELAALRKRADDVIMYIESGRAKSFHLREMLSLAMQSYENIKRTTPSILDDVKVVAAQADAIVASPDTPPAFAFPIVATSPAVSPLEALKAPQDAEREARKRKAEEERAKLLKQNQ